jgi:hypothetical protein
MPTVLTGGDREDVERRLMTGPPLTVNLPSALITIIGWITAIITSFLNFVSYFLGIISDDVATLDECVSKLKVSVPQAAPAAQPTPPTPQQQPSCHPLRPGANTVMLSDTI